MTIIGVAIVLGVGTTVLGSQNTAFDCTTVLGYEGASTTREGTGKAKSNTKTSQDGNIEITFSHGPINAGDTARFQLKIVDLSGNLVLTSELLPILMSPPTGDDVAINHLVGASTESPEITFAEAGRYGFMIYPPKSPGTVGFNIQVGTYTTVDVPESYNGWAKTCQDVNEQNRQAWLLVPVILIVIAAGVILFFLRHGFS
ncbi:MAG: hypothetical protein MPJ22_11615 [Pirellulales bacterium]|nr:hypothetical protein [Pirellulales bacterium]